MREILFRGKRVSDGKWIEGWYQPEVHAGEYHCGVTLACKNSEGWFDDYAVDHFTVGQFTGMTDKNGKKIFEGDIVKGLFLFEMEGQSVVTFRDGAFGLLWRRGNVPEFSAFASICNVEYEVIGNEYDNPELMEVE